MSEVLLDIAMSIDGFAVDRKGHSFYPVQQLRGSHTLAEMVQTTGAVVMDQETFSEVPNNLTHYAYQVPIFVISDYSPDKVTITKNSRSKIIFVTDGITHTIKLARAAAKRKQVTIIGGMKAAQMALEAGVVDLLKIRIINVIAGKGLRLFDHLSDQQIKLETLSTEQFSDRNDLFFKIVRYK
ncbi:MAG: dihydrofolate reductase family protein [Bdellovibrionaceae bacterium]|nr:dihydrofolate reductase family protein [Pseudobdellovibrionaceae bacterium]